jgi:hypothetical protein
MQPRLAVLIDAENVPAKHWANIREIIAAKGSIICCRLFGDFSGGRHGRWLKHAQSEALQTVMQLSGPNACDISMTIAAMDLLHSSKLEGFCIVSSDGDFTPLAQRLRSAGLKVFVFGSSKASESLRNACTEFIAFDANVRPALVAKAA